MATQFNRPPLRRITDFKSKLVGGGARPNLFEVELAFPEELAIDNDVKDKSRFLVKAAALPASNITPIDVNFRGRILKIAGDRTFDTWTITVINDTDFSIRSAFEKWMNSINRLSDATGANNPAMSPFIGTYLNVSANLSYMYLYVLSNTANDEDDTGAKKLITLSVI